MASSLNKGLILHYDFADANTDGSTLRDKSALDNHGTLQNSPDTGKNSPVGEAYQFDSDNSQYITPPQNLIPATDELTISTWTKGGDKQPQSDYFLDASDSSGNKVVRIHLPWSDENVYWDFGDDPARRVSKDLSGFDWQSWNHWVFTVNVGTDSQNIYRNGTLITDEFGSKSLSSSSDALELFASVGGGNNYDGTVSTLRIYDRELSDPEINRLYQQRSPNELKAQSGSGSAGIVAHWPLDDSGSTAEDKIGTNDGTLNGGVTTGTRSPTGRGMNFTKTAGEVDPSNDDYISGTIREVDGSTGFSFCFWVYANKVSSDFAGIVGADGAKAYNRWLFRQSSNGVYQFLSGDDSSNFAVVNLNEDISGRWAHVTCLYDGSEMKVYVDGTLDNSLVSNVPTFTTNSFSFGRYEGGSSDFYYHDGKLSDVRFYDRALSASEVRSIYDQGLPVPESGLEGHWTLDSVEKPTRPTNRWDLGQQPPNLLNDPETFDISTTDWLAFNSTTSQVSNVGPNGETAWNLNIGGGGSDNIGQEFEIGTDITNGEYVFGAFLRVPSGSDDVAVQIRNQNLSSRDQNIVTLTTDWQWVTVSRDISGSSGDIIRVRVLGGGGESGDFYILRAGFNRGTEFDYSTRSQEVQTIPDVVGGADLQNGSSSGTDSNDLNFRSPQGVVSGGSGQSGEIPGSLTAADRSWAFRLYLPASGSWSTALFGQQSNDRWVVSTAPDEGNALKLDFGSSPTTVQISESEGNFGGWNTAIVTIDNNNEARINLNGSTACEDISFEVSEESMTLFRLFYPGIKVSHTESYPVLTEAEAEEKRQRLANEPADPVPPTERWDFSSETNPHNLFPYSEDLTQNSLIGNGTVTTDVIANPVDGTVNADLYTENNTDNAHEFITSPDDNPDAGDTITFSSWVKSDGRDWIRLAIALTDIQAWFNISNGTLGSTKDPNSEIIDYGMSERGNGWYRCWMIVKLDTGRSNYTVGVSNADGVRTYQGDGSSGAYIWGVQLVQGNDPNPNYVTTSGSPEFPQTVPAQRYSRNDLTVGSSSGSDTEDPDWVAPNGMRSGGSDSLQTRNRHRNGNVTWIGRVAEGGDRIQFGQAGVNGWDVFDGTLRLSDTGGNVIQQSSGQGTSGGVFYVLAVRLDMENEVAYLHVDGTRNPDAVLDFSNFGDFAEGDVEVFGNGRNFRISHLEAYTRLLSGVEVSAISERISENQNTAPQTDFGNSILYPKTTDRQRNKSDNFVAFPENRTSGQGKVDNALKFDGAWIEGGQEIVNKAPSSITASAWIRTENLTDIQAVFNAFDGNDPGAFQIRIDNGTITAQGEIWWAVSSEWNPILTGRTLTVNEWVLVTLAYDSSEGSTFYVNGEEVATDPSTGSINWTNTESIEIGNHPNNFPFDGEIDDPRIYSRALSGSEVRKLYRSTAPYYKNEVDGTSSRNVSIRGTISTSILLQHLNFFSDYENWSSGEKLPNRKTVLESSLNDSNGVQEVTSNPIIGTKSGRYIRSDSDFHSANTVDLFQTKSDWCFSFWIRPQDVANRQYVLWNANYGTGGFDVRIQADAGLRVTVSGGGSNPGLLSTTNMVVGEKYFVEFEHLSGSNENNLYINGVKEDTEINESGLTNLSLRIGSRSGSPDYLDAVLDNFAFEQAPPGKLQWPNHSTWLYNNGNGRTWNEIKQYRG